MGIGVNLRILLFIFSIFGFAIILLLLKKEKIPVKYSMVWFLSLLVICVVSLFPISIYKITSLIGFKTTANLVIGIILTLLLFITMVLTIIISNQNKKMILLVQEISILKEKVK